MIKESDQRRFEEVFGRLTWALKRLGFGTKPYQLETEKEDGILWARLASWSRDTPEITTWYGDWFGDEQNRFWVGFQGSEKQVSKLHDRVEEIGVTNETLDLIRYSANWNIDIARKHDGIVYEYDDWYYYIGIYVLDGEDTELGEALEFIDKIVKSIKPLEDRDIAELNARTDLTPTERKALISARRGQGRFRRDLEAIWNNRCAVTGCTTRAVLRASHIKPWREASDAERLDCHNGLLLSANIDALFDRGLVGFDDEGHIVFGPTISSSDRRLLMLDGMKLSKSPSGNLRAFLQHHRSRLF